MYKRSIIKVCHGDRVIVRVRNLLAAENTAIHWHGMHQEATPWMDGVPMVTQCPILEFDKFTYDFWATECGCFFWHAHDGNMNIF